MSFRQMIAFLGLATTLAFALIGVHLIANDALVTLSPGDGCGQVLDRRLRTLLSTGMTIAYASALLFSLSLPTTLVFGQGRRMLILVTVLTIAGYVGGGVINFLHHKHLTACDVFLFGSDAPVLNVLAAAGCLALSLAVLLRRFGKFRRDST